MVPDLRMYSGPRLYFLAAFRLHSRPQYFRGPPVFGLYIGVWQAVQTEFGSFAFISALVIPIGPRITLGQGFVPFRPPWGVWARLGAIGADRWTPSSSRVINCGAYGLTGGMT